MKTIFFRIISYIKFIFSSKSSKGFGIHSPFVFDFTIKVLNNNNKKSGITEIENLRKELLNTTEIIEVEDFGAGSKKITTKDRKISEIAKYSSTTVKNGMLLYNIIQYFNCENAVELGTSLGIGTSYLAFADKNLKIYTIEGSENIYHKAKSNFEKLGLTNIFQYNELFDDVLEVILSKITKNDFIFIDGNHREEATLKYFDKIMPYCHKKTVILLDDISWNKEMRNAWETIIKNPKVTISIDLFFQGIIFVNDDFQKQNFKIRY